MNKPDPKQHAESGGVEHPIHLHGLGSGAAPLASGTEPLSTSALVAGLFVELVCGVLLVGGLTFLALQLGGATQEYTGVREPGMFGGLGAAFEYAACWWIPTFLGGAWAFRSLDPFGRTVGQKVGAPRPVPFTGFELASLPIHYYALLILAC